MKNIASAAIAAFLLVGSSSMALAQDDEFDPAMDDSVGMDEPEPTSSSENSSDSSGATAASGGSDLSMGISVPLFAGLDLGELVSLAGGESSFQTARILYGLDADTWLNISLGINYVPGPTVDDGMGNSVSGDSVFGVLIGAGYRMYKPTEGRVRPYIEPSATISIADVGSVADVLGLSLGGIMGIDYQLLDQLTIGAAIGAALNTTNTFGDVSFNLFTSDINATFWW